MWDPYIFFLFDKFDMLQFLNLRCTTCYFDTSIYCNMIATETIFITLLHYSTVLLTFFIILHIRSDFHKLILYTATLLNSLINSNNFLTNFLGCPIYDYIISI